MWNDDRKMILLMCDSSVIDKSRFICEHHMFFLYLALWPRSPYFDIGCVRLASLGRPCGAHSGEPLTRANRTITLALSWWRHAPQVTPNWPTPQAGHLGLTRVSPCNDVKAIRTYRGHTGVDPGKLNERTLCVASHWNSLHGACFLTNNNLDYQFPTSSI